MSEEILNQILTELKEIKREQSIANERLSSIEEKQDVIFNQTGKPTDFHTETMRVLKNLITKGDVEYYDKKLGEHDREIYKIKNRL